MKRTIQRLVFGGTGGATSVADAGLLVLRVFAGLALALAHGLGKLPPPQPFIDGVGRLGFPVPTVFAWSAALAEFGGGLLLALGLATRPAAVFIAITMWVAAFLQHRADPFLGKERALLFLFIAVAFMLTGAGRYSIDALIRGKRRSARGFDVVQR
jgi:putative oxidoreductase